MKTISTLCATGTVGAAATGLAFGLPQTNPSRSFDFYRQWRDGVEDVHLSSDVENNVGTETSASSRQATPVSFSLRGDTNYNTSNANRSNLNRPATGPSSRLTPDTNLSKLSKSTSDSPGSNGSASPLTLQRRPSRLKRLASLNFSQSSSPPPSSHRPASRSFTFSSSSTAPMLPPGTPAPQLPPNKLVKRSTSQQKPKHLSPSSQTAKKPALKRPATSHQRSFTLSNQSGEADSSLAGSHGLSNQHYPVPGEDERPYTFYFVPRISKDNMLTTTKSKRLQYSTGKFRRIYPKGSQIPSLIPPTSIRPAEIEIDGTLEVDKESFFFGSRPHTPSDLKHFFSSPASAPAVAAANNTPTPNPPRRSFSFGDLISNGSMARRGPYVVKSANGRLRRRISGRGTSAPLSKAVDDESSRKDDDERPSKRREIALPASKPPFTQTPGDRSLVEYAVESDDIPLNSRSTDLNDTLPVQRSANRSPTTARQRENLSPAEYASGKGRSSPSNVSYSSNGLANSTSRQSRHSITTSEITSSHAGSEADAKIFSSGDEDDGDLRSDTLFDSMRTGVTRSSSGHHGLKLETLFDRNPHSQEPVPLAGSGTGVLRTGAENTSNKLVGGQNIIAEEEESSSTPVRTIVPDDRDSNSRRRSSQTSRNNSHASPQTQSLSLGMLEWDSEMDDDDSIWATNDTSKNDNPNDQSAKPTFILPTRSKVFAEGTEGNIDRQLKFSSARAPAQGDSDHEAKNNVFDWSEDQPIDRGSANRSPPRPKTVHGKKDMDSRGGRSAGRIPPSGIHARSQSVPVVPDMANKRASVMNKFGTWGIGSKGVAEDWDEDFDFDISEELTSLRIKDQDHDQHTDSTNEVFVPESIRVQQSNVLANISLLKDWGLMIEELKDLRLRAASVGNLLSENSKVFDEVDAMIDLADQEAEEDILAKRSITSSPGFDLEGKTHDAKGSPNVVNPSLDATAAAVAGAGRQDDVFAPDQHRGQPKTSPAHNESKSAGAAIGRPRKNSEAIARSVIEALQQRRNAPDPDPQPSERSEREKVPFDTATLKHIVPYVNGLMRKVKYILRDAEGLQTTPDNALPSADENLRRAFESPTDESPSTQRDKRRKR